MPSVFISYRRVDSEWAARSLCDRLREHFGQRVFMDVDTIQPGDDFVEAIEEAVGSCDALIALIGAKWLNIQDELGNRRLDSERDYIRLEIATALRRKIRIIPVLIDDASMPRESELPEILQPLARRNAVELRPASFRSDVGSLIQFLQDRVFGPAPTQHAKRVSDDKREHVPTGGTSSVKDEDGTQSTDQVVKTTTNRAVVPPREDSLQLSAEAIKKAAKFGPRLTVSFDQEAYALECEDTVHMLVELEFQPPDPSVLEKIPNNIGLLLDVSGSMRRDGKFELLCAAVRTFLEKLPSKDRASIILFADDAYLAAATFSGGLSSSSIEGVVASIRRAPNLFGRKTNMAPALDLVNGIYSRAQESVQGVERIYVLTDGRLHDRDACSSLLTQICERRAEIGVYGFGTDLEIGKLKLLLRGQHGGWVKPIVHEPDIVTCFGHMSEVSEALLAQQGRLAIWFDSRVLPKDAWVFRPHSRFFGSIDKRHFTCDLGPIESGRVYSLMFELHVSPNGTSPAPVALIRGLWGQGTRINECRTIAAVHRQSQLVKERECRPFSLEEIESMPPARQAILILHALRDREDRNAQLEARRAELVVARRERRNPVFLDALAKELRRLEREADLIALNLTNDEIQLSIEDEFLLSPAEAMLVEADQDSAVVCLEDEVFAEEMARNPDDPYAGELYLDDEA